MRTRLLALAVVVAAALPIAPAHADPVSDVNDLLASLCAVDLCIPPDFGLNCPVLATLAPGVPGVVDINTEGDVVVNGWGVYDCPPYGDLPDPPPDPEQVGWDTVVWVLTTANQWCDVDLCIPPYPFWEQFVRIVDPIVCPILASLAPGVPPDVVIGSDGDVTVRGHLIWDCPPYIW